MPRIVGSTPSGASHSRGRARAPCRPFGRWVSLARPPNRTCDFHRIRLSTNPRGRRRVSSVGAACVGSPVPSPRRARWLSASVFTGDLLAFQSTHCRFAAPLRHVAGFPDLGLLRGLRPIPGSSVDDGPARHHPGWVAGRATPRWFPRSPCTGRRGRRPALLLQPRHGYAAGLPRGLPTGVRNRLRSRPPTRGGRALLTGPHPPDWSRRAD